MSKIFDRPTTEIGHSIKRMNENQWFVLQQPLLLWMASSDYGRDLLCIEKDFPPIIEFSKRHIKGRLSEYTYLSQFHVGAKWANVIRFRWDLFQEYAQYYYDRITSVPVMYPVAPLPGLSYLTSTFYPDPHPETTTVDGLTFNYTGGGGVSWATIYGSAQGSGGAADNITSGNNQISGAGTTDTWNNVQRSFELFDTSALGDTDTIDAATCSIFGNTTKSNTGANTPGINVYSSNPASNTVLVLNDHFTCGTTAYSTAIAYASWSTSAYNAYVFNATGLAAISKTGITKLSNYESTYDAANSPPAWVSGGDIIMSQKYADQTGTSEDPKLVVTHTAVGGPTRNTNAIKFGANF
jgi:hypothetical protein